MIVEFVACADCDGRGCRQGAGGYAEVCAECTGRGIVRPDGALAPAILRGAATLRRIWYAAALLALAYGALYLADWML